MEGRCILFCVGCCVSLLRVLILALDPNDPTLRYLVNSKYPKNEYEHSFNRDMLIDAERKFEHRNGQILSKEEQTVDHYLQYLKWREMVATKASGFPPSRAIEEKLDYIQKTEIYSALKSFPKGGNMHSHEDHQLSKRILFDIVWDSTDFEHLYMLPPNHTVNPWMMDFFITPPVDNPPWIKVKGSRYSMEYILNQNTLIGLMKGTSVTNYPTENSYRWRLITPLWWRCSIQLISNLKIKTRYLQALYEQSLSEGVIYLETRKSLGGELPIYVLNSNDSYIPTNGKQFIGVDGDLEVEIAMELAKNFSRVHPEFVGHKRISDTYRTNSIEVFKQDMDNVARLYKKYPQHVLGFDVDSEEDAGSSLLYYLQNLVTLYDSETDQAKVPLYLHTAETSWPDDLISSSVEGKLVATLQNAYESVLLNAKRIGHGFGVYKHPYLLEILRQRQTPIEVCLASNQLLAYSPDLRNHPGQIFYRAGIPIMLGADDPGTFGYDNFTVDWYEAFMSWGLTLVDLKQLALNSLNYSGLTNEEKQDAIENKWRPMWNQYILNKSLEACARNYALEAANENRDVTFNNLLPKQGAIAGTTRVHVFGRNFESAICKTPVCQFGSRPTNAVYISNQHILCEAPDCGGCNVSSVPVSIALDGTNFASTGFNFTYKYTRMTMPLPPVISTTEKATTNLGALTLRFKTSLYVILATFVFGVLI